ncbi:MAG: serine/threonine protein kinase [Pirellulaceae bacterium]|nr:MAG: serine/threonine protein kinase [Pirellulaceae bacterium]
MNRICKPSQGAGKKVILWLAGVCSSLFLPVLPGCGRNRAPVAEPTAPAPEVTVTSSDAEWPLWRGPDANGISPDASAIVTWGPEKNVLWRVALEGQGHSTPIVVGQLVVLTTAVESRQQQWVLAFDRETGQERWRGLVHEGALPRKHPKNSHASASPVSDGRNIYVLFIHHDGLYATALDFDGEIVWQEKVGTFRSEHGYGSSPALYQGRLFVNGDSLENCFVAAVDTQTGKVLWSTPRTTTGRHGSYATPLVVEFQGKPQLVLSGMGTTDGYDIQTGKRLWSVPGPAEVTACTPAYDGTRLFSSGGYPEKELLAIRLDRAGSGEEPVEWRSAKAVTYVPSPLYHNGRLYVVTDSGVAACLEAATGEVVWQERLQGNFSSSPVLAGSFIYAASEEGKTYVFRAADKFELVAVNDLGEGVFATPVICGGRIYLRTSKALYCLGPSGQVTLQKATFAR